MLRTRRLEGEKSKTQSFASSRAVFARIMSRPGRINGQALGFVLFVSYCVTVLASSQHNTAEDETVDNKDERLPGTTSKSDCLIPLIRVDFSTLE